MAKNTAAVRELELPDEVATGQAASAVAELTEFLRTHPTPSARVELVAEDASGQTQVMIPAVAFRFFVDVLAELANGNAVTVAPVHAELTTQQAADLLNVSRPSLIRLLEDDRIPHRRVGNRRKILLADLLAHKRKDDARREKDPRGANPGSRSTRPRLLTRRAGGVAFTAVYDASVLHPAGLRDLLIRLAQTGMFRARWSEQILDEVIRSICVGDRISTGPDWTGRGS